jgi:hypothetical protein
MDLSIGGLALQQASAVSDRLMRISNNIAAMQQAGFTNPQALFLSDLAGTVSTLAVSVKNLVMDIQRSS